MIIRPYQTADCEALARLFYDTVHTVNAKDYTKAQLDVWATGNVDLEAWDRSLTAHFTLVAEENGVITGFGDMDPPDTWTGCTSTGISMEKALPLSSATGWSRLFPVSSPPTLPSPPDPFLKNGATGS